MDRTVEITVLSAEDLRVDRKPVKKNAYVTVRVDASNYRTTRVDDQGGSYPSWNEKLKIDLPMQGNTQFIGLEVNCRTSSGDRKVGYARMPVTDFMGGYLPEGFLHFLSYRLRDERGERNGIINVSVSVKAPASATSFMQDKSSPMKENNKLQDYGCSSQAAGLRQPVKDRRYGGVVTGVPVWCAYQANA